MSEEHLSEARLNDRRRIIEPITLREFRFADDYEAVRDLWATAGSGVHLGRSDTPDEILKKLTRDPDLFLVAEQNGEIAGAVLGGFDGRRGIMYHLAVSENNRSRGIGAMLMAELENRLKQKGCLKYYLLVTRDNADAIRFYEKRGWENMDELYILGKDL